jgi:outer membrane protein insertion porin family
MLLSLAFALAFFIPCQDAEQRPRAQEAARADAAAQRFDIAAALRERGVEIEFTGNQVFTRGELLDILSGDKSAAEWFVEGIAAEIAGEDKDVQKLEASLYRFISLLRSRGYLKATVRAPRVETSAAGRKLFVSVSEGALYRVGKIEFKGSKLISPERLAEMFPLKTGDAADGEAIYEFLFGKLKKLYADKGHVQYEADAEPTFTAEPSAREGVVDFLISVSEGKRFTLHSVEFEGNAKTADEQLRPLLLLREGETYRQTRLDESLKQLEATGLFERIDRDRDLNYRVNEERAEVSVKIRLKEKSTP